MERAPKRVVLAYPGNGGHRRYEIVSSDFAALRRIEELALAAGGLDLGHPRAGLSQSEGIPLAAHCVRAPSSKSGRVVSFRGRDARCRWERGRLPLPAQRSPVDALPPLNVAEGSRIGHRQFARVAHARTLDSGAPPCCPLIRRGSYVAVLTWWTPARRIIRWDIGFARGGPSTPINPASPPSLDAMPPGLMRENAIEDYEKAVAQGTPNYSVIRLRESSTSIPTPD